MTLTPRGTSLAAVGLGALAASVATGSLAAGVLGAACLLALGLASARAPAPTAEVRRTLGTEITREGVAVDVRTIVKTHPVAGRVEVEDVLPAGLEVVRGAARSVTASEETELEYGLEARIPGRFHIGPLRVSFEDPLGLVRHTATVDASTGLVAYPRTGDVREAVVSSRLPRVLAGAHAVGQAGAGSDFYAMREFQDGDAIRDVNWRASARGGRALFVNQREHESHARVTFLFDARAIAAVGTKRTNARVLGARAFAALAFQAFRRRDRPRIAFYGDGTSRMVEGSAADPTQSALLDAVIDHEPRGYGTLGEAIQALLPTLRPKDAIVVVSHLLDDATVADAVFAMRALGMSVVVVSPRGPDLLALSGASPEAVEAARGARISVLDALRGHGAFVLDWGPTEPFELVVAREAIA